MNAYTKMSAKGQIVIPKSIRDRLKWHEGAALDVVELKNGVLLRPSGPERERITVDEFRRRHRPQPGPTLTVEEMHEAVVKEAARRQCEDDRLRR